MIASAGQLSVAQRSSDGRRMHVRCLDLPWGTASDKAAVASLRPARPPPLSLYRRDNRTEGSCEPDRRAHSQISHLILPRRLPGLHIALL